MAGLDAEQVSRVITAALSGPGGVALVVNVFANVPGVVHSPERRGIFKSEPERIQIGDWRYEVTRDGRHRAREEAQVQFRAEGWRFSAVRHRLP